jgi:hypothetical protein
MFKQNEPYCGIDPSPVIIYTGEFFIKTCKKFLAQITGRVRITNLSVDDGICYGIVVGIGLRVGIDEFPCSHMNLW